MDPYSVETLLASLERMGQLVKTLLWEKAKETGLSPIQIQFLLYIHRHPPERRRVSHLSRAFQLTPPTVSDAISSLVEKGLVEKEEHPSDVRVRTLYLTPKGSKLIPSLKEWVEPLRTVIESIGDKMERMIPPFLQLLYGLQEKGFINSLFMCMNCDHAVFEGNAEFPTFCSLTERTITPTTVKVDCALFEERERE